MNGCILLIANEISASCKKHKILRAFLTALSGSVLELVLLIVMHNYALYLVFSHFAVIPLMVYAAFGRCKIRLFLKNSAACYGVALLLGGCTEAAENTLGIRKLPILAGMSGVLFCIAFFRFFRREKRTAGGLFSVEFVHNGEKAACLGFLDTGNLLREPVNNRPVSIVERNILDKLKVGEQDFGGIVLYRTLGKNGGVLETYRIERLSIKRDGAWRHIVPAVVAAAPDGLLQGKRYEAVLNGDMEL